MESRRHGSKVGRATNVAPPRYVDTVSEDYDPYTKGEASRLSECDHEGPVIIEPGEDDGKETYRASCLTCLAYGPPRATHEDALDVLLNRVRE